MKATTSISKWPVSFFYYIDYSKRQANAVLNWFLSAFKNCCCFDKIDARKMHLFMQLFLAYETVLFDLKGNGNKNFYRLI